jgi:hypothetical protein
VVINNSGLLVWALACLTFVGIISEAGRARMETNTCSALTLHFHDPGLHSHCLSHALFVSKAREITQRCKVGRYFKYDHSYKMRCIVADLLYTDPMQ